MVVCALRRRGAVVLLALCVVTLGACDEPLDLGTDGGVAHDAAPDPCKSTEPPAFCNEPRSDAGAGCSSHRADGVCDPDPLHGDTCACEDCVGTAWCEERCSDDGYCDSAAMGGSGKEDCTCLDCHAKTKGCAPPSIGCHTDGICSLLEDDCTCPDCADDMSCRACTTNGYCAVYAEACACADCAKLDVCTGLGPQGLPKPKK